MTRELFKTPELAPDRTTVVTPTVLVATTSCWYPTARLFRQTALEDWDGVISRVGEALTNNRSAAF